MYTPGISILRGDFEHSNCNSENREILTCKDYDPRTSFMSPQTSVCYQQSEKRIINPLLALCCDQSLKTTYELRITI